MYTSQNLWLPSFFTSSVTLHAYSDVFGFIFLKTIRTLICLLTSTSSHNDNLLDVIRQDGKPWVSTICSLILQHPSLPLWQANTSKNCSSNCHKWSTFTRSKAGSTLILDLISPHLPYWFVAKPLCVSTTTLVVPSSFCFSNYSINKHCSTSYATFSSYATHFIQSS